MSSTSTSSPVAGSAAPLPLPPGSERLADALDRRRGFATRAIHGWTAAFDRVAGVDGPPVGPILTPIVQSSTYRQREPGGDATHTYSRVSNPTVDALERALGAIEESEPAVAFASGLAATHALALTFLGSGDHAVVSATCYGGTVRLLRETLAPLGVRATFVDGCDLDAVAAAFEPRTRLVLIETPGNPTLALADIAAIAKIAAAAGVPLAVDNTFLTAAFQRPLDLGATVSLLSTTKWVDGHNATIGGALLTRDALLRRRFAHLRKSVGSIQSPFDAWLTLQGAKTLPLRLERHAAVAERLAVRLEGHPALASVRYPSLASFPQRDLALRQHRGAIGLGHGGIIALDLVGGRAAAVRLARSLEVVTLAESVGAVESLLTHPVTMTHGDVPLTQRRAAGIGEGLVRLSVGLEEESDLVDDLLPALDRLVVSEREVARVD